MPASCSASTAACPDRGICSASTRGIVGCRGLSCPRRLTGLRGETEGGGEAALAQKQRGGSAGAGDAQPEQGMGA